ncbi:MAG: serine protease [Gemmatimonadales bacterium]|nr:serine protease [Gemmatimonadales bacterium]
MTHRNVVRFVSSALVAAVVYGCSDNSPSVGPSAGLLQVDPPYSGFLTGDTVQFTATLNGVPASVTWQTSDASIATVSSTGQAIGIADGRAAITASMTSDATQIRSASVTVTKPPLLAKGVAQVWDNIDSGTLPRDKGLTYRFDLPAGMTSVTVTFTGGTGDGDIYIQKDKPNTDPANFGNESPGCHSWNAGNAESCTVAAPAAGSWYIFIAVWDAYSGAKLTATAN